MLIMLYWPPTNVRRIFWRLRSQHCRSKPKQIWFDQMCKIQPHASTFEPQLLVFSKSSNSQDYFFRVQWQPPIQFTPTAVQPHFLSGCLLRQIIFISFPHGRKSTQSDYGTWTKRHREVKILTKLNDKI